MLSYWITVDSSLIDASLLNYSGFFFNWCFLLVLSSWIAVDYNLIDAFLVRSVTELPRFFKKIGKGGENNILLMNLRTEV